ncbi:MAG: DUF362 domain-containing protein [Candidatus Hodarchaeota archaeon]
MMKSSVSLCSGIMPYETTMEALKLVKDVILERLEKWEKGRGKKEKKILIKPNLLSTDLNYFCNTSVDHCLAIADFFENIGNYNIFIGDGTTYESKKNPSTLKALENHGFMKYRGKWMPMELHDDKPGRWFEIVNHESDGVIELAIARLSIDAFLVSAAKLKTHDVLGLTLSIKNLMGCLNAARYKGKRKILKKGDVKGFMHGFLDKKPHLLTKEQNIGPSKVALAANIIKMASCRQPDLSVIDGSSVMEGKGPRRGNACEDLGNIALAGTDAVAVDATCARIAGFSLESFQYIRIAGMLGLGNHLEKNISYLGMDPSKMRASVNPHPLFNEASPWKDEEIRDLSSFVGLNGE